MVEISAHDVIYFIIMKIAEIGSYIERRRKSLRITQRNLAMLCGVSEHALCSLERGEGNPTFEVLERVADALGLELRLGPKILEGSCEA